MVEKPQSQSRKRVMQNPPRGVTIKKRKITKNSPKCKVSTNAVTTRGAFQTVGSGVRRQLNNPPIQLIPAMARRGADFQSDPSTLP